MTAIPDELAKSSDREAAKASTELARPVKNWTLGTYFHGARQVARINQIFGSRLRRQLGDDWQQRLDALHQLRNDFSHGRLATVSDLTGFAGATGDMLRRIIDVCAFAFRCRALVEEHK